MTVKIYAGPIGDRHSRADADHDALHERHLVGRRLLRARPRDVYGAGRAGRRQRATSGRARPRRSRWRRPSRRPTGAGGSRRHRRLHRHGVNQTANLCSGSRTLPCRRSATTPTRTAPPPTSPTATTRRGGSSRTATNPAIGDHEYETPNASGYFNYFADRLAPVRRQRAGSAARLLQLRPRRLARGRPQRDLLRDRGLQRERPAGLAQRRPCGAHEHVHACGARGPALELRDACTEATPRCRATGIPSTRTTSTSSSVETTTSTSASPCRIPRASTAPGHGLRQFTVGTGGGSLYTFARTEGQQRGALPRHLRHPEARLARHEL